MPPQPPPARYPSLNAKRVGRTEDHLLSSSDCPSPSPASWPNDPFLHCFATSLSAPQLSLSVGSAASLPPLSAGSFPLGHTVSMHPQFFRLEEGERRGEEARRSKTQRKKMQQN